MIRLSRRSRFIQNPILELDPIAEALSRKGKKIIKLNRGDPPVYFKTPQYMIKAYIEALKEHQTGYSRASGTKELAGAVIGRYKRMYGIELREEDIIATAGVTEALLFINHSLIEERDNAVMFKPYYPQYIPRLMSEGGVPLFGMQDMTNGWNINTDELFATLRKARSTGKLSHTKYMIITNPCNPTGNVMDRNELKGIVDIANEYNLLLVSDEIYDEIVFKEHSFTSMAQVAKGIPHMILNGSSKNFDSTGFRIGFIILPEQDEDSDIMKKKLADYALTRLSLNTPAQHAVAVGMNNVKEHKKAIRKMTSSIRKRVDTTVKALEENPLIQVVKPKGTFYVFPRIDLSQLDFKDGDAFVRSSLFEAGVQLTRGSAFGAPSNFRIVALPEEKTLELAIDKINRMCRRHRKR